MYYCSLGLVGLADEELLALTERLVNETRAAAKFTPEELQLVLDAPIKKLALFLFNSESIARQWQELCRDQLEVLLLRFQNDHLRHQRELHQQDKKLAPSL
jgi:hypothetical protein